MTVSLNQIKILRRLSREELARARYGGIRAWQNWLYWTTIEVDGEKVTIYWKVLKPSFKVKILAFAWETWRRNICDGIVVCLHGEKASCETPEVKRLLIETIKRQVITR